MIENCGECYRRWYCYIDPRECDKLTGSVSVTNADRIRSMTDEELAMCLYEIGYDEGWDKPEYALKWLQQPAEDTDDFLKRYTGMEKDGKLVFAACEIKQDFADMISNATTVDAVEVVRCKDCIYSYEEFGFIYCTFGPYGDCKVPSQFYCAEGKRKEDK